MSDAFARRTDPATSHEAAHSVDASRLERMVYHIIQSRGDHGATSDEVAQTLSIDLQSITPRFKPLETKGFICRTDRRRSSLTSNRSRQVWIAVDQSRE